MEEAQQNKTQMRLRRDSSGNYSYQFVADSDSIADAQRELDEARNSLYNMDKDEYKDNQQAILDIYTEYQEKMREAADLSAEERALIEKEYNERINALIQENGVIRANLAVSAMEALADAERNVLMNEIIPQWDGAVQQMIDKIAAEGGLGPACEDAMKQLDSATKEYHDELAEIEETAGITFDSIAEGQDINIDLAEELADRQADNIDLTIDEMNAVRDLVAAVEDLKSIYDDTYKSATKALSAAQDLREFELGSAANSVGSGSSGGGSGSGSGSSGSAGSGGSGGAAGTGSGSGGASASAAAASGDLLKGIATAIWCTSNDGWGDSGSARKANLDNKLGAGTGDAVQSIINAEGPSGGLYNYWVSVLNKDASRFFYNRFNTGGYTGDWIGSHGKFAMLDKKEIVLNADDTSKFLSAIGIVRDMGSLLDAVGNAVSARIAGMGPRSFGGFDGAGFGGSLDQNVIIEANFPNASNRNEIEAAFENLVNRASQHAYDTRR